MKEETINQEYKRNYYDKHVDIEKTKPEDIKKLHLLSLRGSLGTKMLYGVIVNILKSKGINQQLAYEIENFFHEKYPKGKSDVLDIEHKYRDIFDNLEEEYEIKKYQDKYGRIDKNYLSTEEIRREEEYEKKLEDFEVREKVEIHNIVVDLADKVEKNFDELLNVVSINYKKQR